MGRCCSGAINSSWCPVICWSRFFDPTGAGDCFAGGFIGYLAACGLDLKKDHIDRKELSRAVIYGSVMGSFCCEKFGVDRFRNLSRTEIDARFPRIQNLHGLLKFGSSLAVVALQWLCSCYWPLSVSGRPGGSTAKDTCFITGTPKRT